MEHSNTYKPEFVNSEIFTKVREFNRNKNYEIYVVGGYVRDKLLMRRNKKDIDFVINGNGIEFANKFAKYLGIKKISIYKTFGTAMFNYGDAELEFVGARKESYSPESRNPTVQSGTIEDDQKRRDFTINTLAISLNEETYGKLIDPFDGLHDLYYQTIRTPLNPDITFSDDPLRMLRAIRFACQLDFQIDSDCLSSIKKNKSRIKIITAERIHTELNKILLANKPSIGFKLLFDTGLLELIFPELHALSGVNTKNNISHKDNFLHSIQVVDNIAKLSDDLWLRWAALLHDIAKPRTRKFVDGIGWTFYSHNFIGAKMVPEIFKKLKLPLNEKMKFVQKMVDLHMRPIALVEDIVTDSAVRRLIVDAGDDIEHLMNLCEADITSKNEKRISQYLQNFKLVRQKIVEVEERDSLRNFQPPISGEEIMAFFNIPPSKAIGDIKNAIKEAILEGTISNNYDDAKIFMISKGKELGLIK